jgi:RNA polymerase sigma-70 factor (ECF subfamily)
MSHGTAAPETITAEIDRIIRADGGRLLSCLVVILRDFQLAEDSLHDALESAIVHWGRSGVPSSPSAWLMRTARRKAIDRIRRAINFRQKSKQLEALIALDAADEPEAPDAIPDERLKLIFTCCHPALDRSVSVALTLRSICGLTTEEIARAHLVTPDAMAQRLVRARHKIAKAGIGYEIPDAAGFAARLDAVLAVLYLIFNEGYAASSEQYLRTDLCEEAIRLARLLDQLMPGEPEVEGLLALILLHHSRSQTRVTATGDLVALEDQDRATWDRALIEEGTALVTTALGRGRPAPYQLQAAIAALHAEAESFAATDWPQLVLLYDELLRRRPNPVFALNRLVALSYTCGPAEALAQMIPLAEQLPRYQPYHAVRADLCARLGQTTEAAAHYAQAIALSTSEAERQYLRVRRERLG